MVLARYDDGSYRLEKTQDRKVKEQNGDFWGGVEGKGVERDKHEEKRSRDWEGASQEYIYRKK